MRHRYHNIAGIFCGGKFLWMLKLLLVRGESFVVESSLVTVYSGLQDACPDVTVGGCWHLKWLARHFRVLM